MAIPLNELLNQPADPRAFICFPLIPAHGLVLIAAQKGTYKSFMAINLAYDLAEGSPLFGIWKLDKPQSVLVIEQELGHHTLKTRLALLHGYRQGQYAPYNLWTVSKDLDCQLDTRHGIDTVMKHVLQAKAEVVVFDPFVWFHSQDEIDNTRIHSIIKTLQILGKQHNFAQVIVHHMAKPSLVRSGNDVYSIRGASSLFGAADTALTLVRNVPSRPELITVEITLRHDENPPPLQLTFDKDTSSFMKRS